ncbi:hypothetical protein OEZ86_002510 [Tetradesmus obliquus]|nr:hypothetical protein OEZ86_002510 [Tetradesmus obliquus]
MADQTYPSISLGSRGAVTTGTLKVGPAGFVWRRAGEHGQGRVVDVRKEDISGLVWTRLGQPRGCLLGVRRADGPTINFLGFKDKDLDALSALCKDSLKQAIKPQELAIFGRNWGEVELNASSLVYSVDSKVMFELPLPEVSQAQQTKDEVLLEFHVDDTTRDDREDTLVEMAFHVPAVNEAWGGTTDDNGVPIPAAKALVDALLQHTDAGVATSDDSIADFTDVAVIAPRGRFTVEMHGSFLKLSGQTQDFKIRYTSISRLFILPKSSTPHTLVVIGLDPPIRKGQTYYSYLLCQFNNDEEMSLELDMSDEALAQKNEKCGNKLQRTMNGPVHTVFAHTLRGLSAAKITRAKTETYTNHAGDGCAIRCSYKADDGFLYPLDKAFFYVHKPPMCINHSDIESVEFQRQGGGVISSSVRTFDLLIKQRSNNMDYQFRNIQRSEWEPLFAFINARKIKIENLAEARHGPRGPGVGIDLGDDLDAGVRAARAEADDDEEDEDEDFDAGGEDMSASSGGSLDEENAGSDDDASSDAEMVDEEGIDVTAVMGNKKKRKADGDAADGDAAAAAKPPKQKKPKKEKKEKAEKPAAADGEAGEGTEVGDGKKARKPRKKKDPNAPKKALSGFMFFSNSNRERIKTENPGIPFGQVGKLLGEEWKKLSAEDRAPYEAQAAKDKERYAAAMADYKAAGGGAAEDYKAAGGGAAAGAAGDADEGDGDDAGDEEAAE